MISWLVRSPGLREEQKSTKRFARLIFPKNLFCFDLLSDLLSIAFLQQLCLGLNIDTHVGE